MLFASVSVEGVAHVDAPVRVTSADIVERLRPTFDRVGVRPDLLDQVAGIRERRYWQEPARVADGATLAGRKAIEKAGVDPGRIGLLVSTSVSRDYIEPSTASVVHGALGLPYMPPEVRDGTDEVTAALAGDDFSDLITIDDLTMVGPDIRMIGTPGRMQREDFD